MGLISVAHAYSLVDDELTFDVSPFAFTDELTVGEIDTVEWTLKFFSPEIDKLIKFRKLGGDVFILPDILLQDELVVRQAIENSCQYETVSSVHGMYLR